MHWNFPWRSREKDSDPIQREGAWAQSFLPSSSSAGWTSRVDFPGAAQHRHCSALTWAHVQNPLANTRVCSRWEQHIPANTHGVLSPLYQGHTCLTHSLKFSQDLFCPPLSTHAWKIPSKARHKTLHGWVLSMSSPGELKCEVSQNMLQDNDVLSRSGRKVVIQASVEQWLPSLSAIDLTAAWGLHGIGRQSPSPRVGNAKWGFHILQLLLTEREGCPENFPVMR